MTNRDEFSQEEAEMMLYLFGELDQTQVASFESKLAESPALREQLESLRGVDNRFVADRRPGTAMASERALKSSLRVVREQLLVQNSAVAAVARFKLPPYAVAAAIAVVFTLGFITWLYTTPPVTNQPAQPQANRTMPGGLFPMPGQGPITTGFAPTPPDMYAESSQQIDREIDALSMLSDFEDRSDPD